MKLCLIAALVAACSATAPPKIQLDLVQHPGIGRITELATPQYRSHDLGYTQPNGADVTSVQDFTMKCQVKVSNPQNCQKPTASAFDHNGGQIAACESTTQSNCLSERLFLVNLQNKDTVDGVQLPVECTAGSAVCTGVNWNKIGTYLYKYDATDASGNHAEQLVFALIIDDINPPQISADAFSCHEAPECKPSSCTGEHAACKAYLNDQDKCEHYMRTRPQWGCKWQQSASAIASGARDCFPQFRTQGFVEAATPGWRFCPSNAVDLVDGPVPVKYTIQQQDNGRWWIPQSTPSDYAGAKNTIDTLTTGVFEITAIAEDQAGGYGASGQNNRATATMIVEVKDTRHPFITVHGFGMIEEKTEWDHAMYPCDPSTHKWGCKDGATGFPLECGTVYKDDCTADEIAGQGTTHNVACEAGASLNDKLDDANLMKIFAQSSLTTTPINIMAPINQEITYTGFDSHNLAAEPKKRIVSVRDTTPPVLELTPCAEGNCIHQAGTAAWVDPGAVCKDTCDPNPKMDDSNDADLKDYPKWDREFDGVTMGTFKRTYRCKDRAGLITEMHRFVEVIDSMAPEITMTPCSQAPKEIGAPHCLVEASKTGVFTDPGVSCHDVRDGNIEVPPPTGIVNLGKVGTYNVEYSCTDAKGNESKETRYVKVVDTTAPVLTLKGQATEYTEAGFPWTDQMAPCTLGGCAMDNIDGDISDAIVATGGTVNVANAFAKFRTCAEISAAFNKANGQTQLAPSGEYMLTLPKGSPMKVYCDMTHERTYVPLINAAPIMPYNKGENGDCADLGLEVAQWESDSDAACLSARAHFGSAFFPQGVSCAGASQVADNYLCSTNKNTYTHQTDAKYGDMSHAVPGEYIIKYEVEDKSGNKASPLTRTVIVRDTLAPVIVMRIQDKQHISDSSTLGLNGVSNPAGDAAHNPFIMSSSSLMSEETQASASNTWFLAAAASAVTGVALLAMRKSSPVATSVPV